MKQFSHIFACVTGALAFGLLVFVIFTGRLDTSSAATMTSMAGCLLLSLVEDASRASLPARKPAPTAPLRHWSEHLILGVLFLGLIVLLAWQAFDPALANKGGIKGPIIAFIVVLTLLTIMAMVQYRSLRASLSLSPVAMARKLAELRGGVPLSPEEMAQLEAAMRRTGRS